MSKQNTSQPTSQPQTSWEVETTFAVSPETELPDWLKLAAVHAVGTPQEYTLRAEYFDTAELDLSRAHTALRRRVGGKDAGWHIKRQAQGGREEIHAPLSDAIPDCILHKLPAQFQDRQALAKIAQIDNHRTEYLLYDAAGQAIAEFCDDQVRTVSYVAEPPHEQQWREWEVEITVAGQAAGLGEAFLTAVADLCQHKGAQHRPDASKLQRTLYGTTTD
ncbi:MAG: CYTH domain-containing protein [Corynebacterium sp.]|nr:CYTH domain-containing protein [Corynebacterium sp.]